MPYWSIVNIKIEKLLFDQKRDHPPLKVRLLMTWGYVTVLIQMQA